jgi:WD40 repeat protein
MLNKPPDDTPLERHRDWLQGVAISSDNGLIVSNSADGNLQMWPMPADVGEMISSELTKNVSRMLLDHGYKPRLPTTSYVRVWKSLLTF